MHEPDFVNVDMASCFAVALRGDVICGTATWNDPRIEPDLGQEPGEIAYEDEAINGINCTAGDGLVSVGTSYMAEDDDRCFGGLPRQLVHSSHCQAKSCLKQDRIFRFGVTFVDEEATKHDFFKKLCRAALPCILRFREETAQLHDAHCGRTAANPNAPCYPPPNSVTDWGGSGCLHGGKSKPQYGAKAPSAHPMTRMPAGIPSHEAVTPEVTRGTPSYTVHCPLSDGEVEATLAENDLRDRYVFFDTASHVRWRNRLDSWGLKEIIQDAIQHSSAQPIVSVTVLRHTLARLPRVQIVLGSANLPPGWRTTPVDLRAVGHDICTIGIPADASSYEAAFRTLQHCKSPNKLANLVAKARWEPGPPNCPVLDPFKPGVLDIEAALVCNPVSIGGSSSSGDSTSSKTHSTASQQTPFECMAADCTEGRDTFTVAFHAVGHRPWTHEFARVATPDILARVAAQHMAVVTGVRGWRTQFLQQQPWVSGIDLHCLISPIAPHQQGVFLADFRRVFGAGLQNLAALATELGTPQAAGSMAAAATQKLREWALADPPDDFVITTARRGALLVPAGEEVCIVVDTLQVVHELPGLRQHLLQAPGSGLSHGSLSGTISGVTVATCPTSTTTTSTAPNASSPELPFWGVPLPSREPLLVRLGLASLGVFTVEFQGNPDADAILARAWAAVMREHDIPPGLAFQLAPCQPATSAVHREILLTDCEDDASTQVAVWIDLRPQGLLHFRKVHRTFSAQALLAEFPFCKGFYLNGRLWDDSEGLHQGDYIVGSITPQAPDVRSNSYFLQRISGLCAFTLPFMPPEQVFFESTGDFELDQEIAEVEWQEAIYNRMAELGQDRQDQSAHFVILGPRFFAIGAGQGTPTLHSVAAWLRQWARPFSNRLVVHDTGGFLGACRLFVVTSTSMDRHQEYVRIHAIGDNFLAFRAPHQVLPAQLRQIVPISDADNRPVPGRDWYGPEFPSTDLHPLLCVGHTQTDDCGLETAVPGPHRLQPVCRLQRRQRSHARARTADATEASTWTLEGLEAAAFHDAGGQQPVFYFEGDRSTTDTTTNMLTVPGDLMVSVVAGPAIAMTAVHAPTPTTLASTMAELVTAHVIRGRVSGQAIIRMAQAHPTFSRSHQEALFILMPLDLRVHILIDARQVGRGLVHRAIDSDEDPWTLARDEGAEDTCFLYINGIPAPLFRSPWQDGDYLLISSEPCTCPAYSRQVLFRRWPLIGILAIDALVIDTRALPTEERLIFGAILRDFERACDLCHTQLGFRILISRQAFVCSRERGEIIICVPGRLPVTRDQAATAITLLQTWVDVQEVVDSRIMSGDHAVFLARDAAEMRQTWHLVPIPHMLQLYALWPVDPCTVVRTAELPARAGLTVSAVRTPAHGHTHHFHPTASHALNLIQQSATLSRSIHPDPHGEPQISFAEQAAQMTTADIYRITGCRADHLQVAHGSVPHIAPSHLEAIIDRAYLAAIRGGSFNTGGDARQRYTIFDTRRHCRTRYFNPSARPEFLIHDIIASTPEAIRSIRLLQDSVPGFPTPQFTVTLAASMPGWITLPFDARGIGHGICTASVQPGCSWRTLGETLDYECATAANSRDLGEDFLRRASANTITMRTPHMQINDPLPRALHDIDYIRLSQRPPPPPVPTPLPEIEIDQRERQEGTDPLDNVQSGTQSAQDPIRSETTTAAPNSDAPIRDAAAHVTALFDLEQRTRICLDEAISRSHAVLCSKDSRLSAADIGVHVYDPFRQCTTFKAPRTASVGSTLFQVVCRASFAIKRLKVLEVSPIESPGLHVVLTPDHFPADMLAVPVDGSPVHSRVCVTMLRAGESAEDVLRDVDGTCRWQKSALRAYRNGSAELLLPNGETCKCLPTNPADITYIRLAPTSLAPSDVCKSIPTPHGRRCITASHDNPCPRIAPCKLALTDLVPEPAAGVTLGTTPDMLQTLLEGHTLNRLHADLPQAPRLDRMMHACWNFLPTWDPDAHVQAIFLFTDGSWDPKTGVAAWAVVCLVRQQDIVRRAGCASGLCCNTDMPTNSFRAECEAVLHARAIALSMAPTPVVIASDCSAALAVTHGQAPCPPEDWVSEAALNLLFTSAAYGQPSQSIWIPSHDGCLFNGIADALAHAAVKGGHLMSIGTGRLLQEAKNNSCAWHWVHGNCASIGAQLPPVGADGAWTAAACQTQMPIFPRCPALLRPEPDARETPCFLKIVQYNCLSLRAMAVLNCLPREHESTR